MFKSIGGRGFMLSFSSGLTISVQFGYGHYCHNRNNRVQRSKEHATFAAEFETESPDAEIAIWETESGAWVTNDFVDCHGDDVKGYLNADVVADIIHRVSLGKAI